MDAGYATLEDFLEHFGVKGMRWGVRKSEPTGSPKQPKGELVLEHNFRSGEKVAIYKSPPSLIAKTLSRMSKGYAKDVENYPQFNFHDKNGVRIGEGAFVKNPKTKELYLDWVHVKAKHRGKGYASAAMKGVIKYAQNEGYKKMTLEVPGNAPDARHIYEKLGFRSNGKDTPSEGPHDPFDGLYGMELKVPQKRVSHAQSAEEWEEEFADEFAALLIENFGGDVEHAATLGDFLEHFGVMGMKWGQKKARPLSADAKKKQSVKEKVKSDKVGAVTNLQLQTAIRRMQLEQDFKRLSINEKSGVARWISSTLAEIGKREVQAELGKQLTVAAIKKLATGGLG